MDNIPKHIRLSEFLSTIREGIKLVIPDMIWIVAEISEIHTNYSGHCYLELIDRDSDNDLLKGKVKATVWANKFRMIQAYFNSATGQNLDKGLQIMVQVSAEFHEIYGISLNIHDINPYYTIGEQERKRREIIQQLENDGIIDLNKEIELPEIIKTIAIISSETAAGYGDFINQLQNNVSGYKFHMKIFPAVMQGNKAEESIINALEKIYQYENIFDAVVIIRGGGAQSDLQCFDNYNIAANIAQFPLPVFTGIGHERDDTITDMVAHTKLKTPTAVAEFLLSFFDNFNELLEQYSHHFTSLSKKIIEKNKEELYRISYETSTSIKQKLKEDKQKLKDYHSLINTGTNKRHIEQTGKIHLLQEKLLNSINREIQEKMFSLHKSQNIFNQSIKSYYINQKNRLSLLNEKIKQHDPQRILEQGYSLIFDSDNNIVRSKDQLSKGDTIRNRFSDGEIESVVK